MISIVIPAYNEAGAVADTVRSALKMFQASNIHDGEVVVVDDGSSDNTALEAENAGAILVRQPHNVGYGHSLKDGIKKAKHDTIVICDADGTYPIDAIPGLLGIYEKGFDMVVGARVGKHYEESSHKKILRWLLRFLVQFTAGREIPDINSGLRVFSKRTVFPYLVRLCDTFSFTTSLTLAYAMTGRFIAYEPITYESRIGATKVRLFRDSLRTLQYIVEAITFYNPLKIFVLFSMMLLLFSLLGFAFTMVTGLAIGYIAGVGSMLLSVVMFGLGLLAVLLKQILERQ